MRAMIPLALPSIFTKSNISCRLKSTVIWPTELNFHLNPSNTLDKMQQDIDAFRELKLVTTRIADRRQQKVFSVLEMKYRQLSGEMSRPDYIVTRLYGVMSNYGRSLSLPVFWLGLSLILFTCIFSIILSPILNFDASFDFKVIENGFRTSFMNSVIPFRTLFNNPTTPIMLLCTLQSLISAFLLFQLGSAIRWLIRSD